MEDIRVILKDLNVKGIAFSVVDGKLKSKAPKGAITPDIIALVKQRKDDIIRFMSADRVIEHQSITRVTDTKDHCYPASSAQKRLWVTQHLQGSEGIYNIPLHLTFDQSHDKAFNKQALVLSLNDIVSRHEALRTTFIQDGGEVIQCVNAPRAVTINEYDYATLTLTPTPDSDTKDAIKAIIRRESTTPFDLQNDLMLRCAMIKSPGGHTEVLICVNHIAADGWSVDILLQALMRLYHFYQNKDRTTNPLAEPLALQYKDFTAWQTQYFQSEEFNKTLDIWQKRLSGIPLQHSLALDFKRPETASAAGKNITLKLDSALSAKINQLKTSQNITTFMLMQGMFALLLSRWSHESDIVIGTPVAGREHIDTKGMIGFFINTLVLRNEPNAEDSVAEFLNQTKTMVLEAMEHQVMPFERLVEALNPDRSNQMHPIFQIVFSYNSGKKQILADSGIHIQYPDLEIAKYDVHLQVTEEENGDIWLNWEYNTDIFHPDTIASLSASYQVMLNSAATEPTQKIASLSAVSGLPMSDDISHGIANAAIMNAEPVVYPVEALLHESFAQKAACTPDKTALVLDNQSCTYAELEHQANQLSTFLTTLGVMPGQLVGLYVERSIEMITGILAILKAGGAYLPLDPDNPMDRTAFIVEDANVAVVLTQSHLTEQLRGITDKAIIDIQTLTVAQPGRASEIGIAAPLESPAGQLAYVIYTSGSTGKPKGVPIEHQNVQRLFASAQHCFSFSDQDKWTLFHSFAFDFSVWEIWGALIYGGTLVIVPYTVSRDPQQFSELLIEQQVTVLNQTPSSFYQVSEQLLAKVRGQTKTQSKAKTQAQSEAKAPACALRYVVFGGEALEPFRLRKWFNHFADSTDLINMYGITETTVHVTYYRVKSEDVSRARSPIGMPLNDLTCVVCNENMQLQPIGAIGELLVGGAGLAPYYLNRAELTQARFIYPQALKTAGFSQRFYRSGDLVRMGVDGCLEYFGRADQQVKLRGFRIELGEIERTIEQLDDIQKSLVRLYKDDNGDSHLVAYLELEATFRDLTHKDNIDTVLHQLKAHLAAQLPAYMSIHRFMLLDEMPLTNNGKIDLRRLPSPEQSTLVRSQYVAPQSADEKTLCKLWQQVLQCTRVGLDDNFFALGGDSIRVLQLVNEMGKAGFAFEVADIFANQSVGQLVKHNARAVKDSNKEIPWHVLPDLALALVNKPQFEDVYPLSALQQRMVDQHLSYSGGVYAPMHIVKFCTEHFDVTRLQNTLTGLIRKYPVFRTRIGQNDGQAVQYIVHINVAEQPFDCIDIPDDNALEHIESSLRSLAFDQAFTFNEDSPLVRFVIFKGKSRDGYLMILTHHAIEDGWGFVRVLNDLEQSYFADKATFKAILNIETQPEDNIFKQHIALEIEAANNPQYRDAWQSLLANYQPMNQLFSNTKNTPFKHGEYRCNIGVDELVKIKNKAAELQISVRTLFMYAWYKALAILAQQDSVTVDIVTNARSARLSDPTGAVGLFWNLLPINLSLTATDKGIGDQVSDIRQLHKILLEAEQYALYPRSAIETAGLIEQEDFASFNFVNFHNYNRKNNRKNNLKNDANNETMDDESGMSVVKARDHFHHELKCTVSLSPDQQSVDLWFEYNTAGVFANNIATIAASYCTELRLASGIRSADAS